MTNHHNVAAQENLAFSLMGRLHVIIRRQSGRVTDIEYMRIDPAYCRYLLKLAREMSNDDLHQICEKLEELYFGPEGLFVQAPPRQPLLAQLAGAGTATANRTALEEPAKVALPVTETPKAMDSGVTVDQSYIGRLR